MCPSAAAMTTDQPKPLPNFRPCEEIRPLDNHIDNGDLMRSQTSNLRSCLLLKRGPLSFNREIDKIIQNLSTVSRGEESHTIPTPPCEEPERTEQRMLYRLLSAGSCPFHTFFFPPSLLPYLGWYAPDCSRWNFPP